MCIEGRDAGPRVGVVTGMGKEGGTGEVREIIFGMRDKMERWWWWWWKRNMSRRGELLFVWGGGKGGEGKEGRSRRGEQRVLK